MGSPPPTALTPTSERKKQKTECPSFALRRDPLLLGFASFVFPFARLIVMHAAEREELLFIVNHLLSARAGKRIIFHQKDRLFGTDFLRSEEHTSELQSH